MTEILEIKGRQILKIKTLFSNKPYNAEEGSPLHGQYYNTYLLDGKPFSVNTNDDFVKWRDAGVLYSADFKPTTYEKEVDGEIKTFDSLQLVTCTNIKQETAMASAEYTLAKIYRAAETGDVNEDVLSSLLVSTNQ